METIIQIAELLGAAIAASWITSLLTIYSNNMRTFNAGTWTASECQDVRVKFYAKRGDTNVNTDYAMRVYGGTLTIQYYE